MKSTPLIGLILLTIIDLTYTTIGALYGGGGAELNPMFSWVTDPIMFVVVVTITKAIVLVVIIAGLMWLDTSEQDHKDKWAYWLAVWANVFYALMLIGIVGMNVWYQITIAGG